MSMDFARLNALAEGWMRTRQAHLERERGSVYFHGQRVAKGVLELRRRVTEDASHDEILRAAAIFHDIGKGIEPHAQSGAALVVLSGPGNGALAGESLHHSPGGLLPSGKPSEGTESVPG